MFLLLSEDPITAVSHTYMANKVWYILMKNQIRANKYEPIVQEVELKPTLNMHIALRHPPTIPSSITNLTAPHSSDPGVTSTHCYPNRRTALADDCVIHCPAHPHHHNSNFSTIQSGGCIPQTPR
ncbi:hypothetical protein TNCV_2430191 [Trichonephila clavipes]|nr:hypothetical protein TNCV_2430191 [Trichonephila clavipes]